MTVLFCSKSLNSGPLFPGSVDLLAPVTEFPTALFCDNANFQKLPPKKEAVYVLLCRLLASRFETIILERCSPRQKSRMGTSQGKSGTCIHFMSQWILLFGSTRGHFWHTTLFPVHRRKYRGTSLIRNTPTVGPYSNPTARDLRRC